MLNSFRAFVRKIQMQVAAFKYHHASEALPFNSLAYCSALNRARNLAIPATEVPLIKRRSLEKSEESEGLCDVFTIQRPQQFLKDGKPQKSAQPGKRIDILVFEIIKYFHSNRDSNITLDYLSEKLDIEKRKIYDLINLFTSFELIKRVGKGCYTWNGIEVMRSRLEKVPRGSHPDPHRRLCSDHVNSRQQPFGL